MSGIMIGDKHTEKDWGLMWTDISLPAPDVQTNFVTVPYRNGLLDLTEALGTGVRYKNRTLSFSFVFHDKDTRVWQAQYSDIMKYCHGKSMRIVLDTDPFYYYEGRISVSSVKTSPIHSSFTINVNAHPFRYPITSTTENWLWDPFCFETDIIRDYGYIKVNKSSEIIIIAGYETEVPVFHCDNPMQLQIDGKNYTLKSGSNKIYDFMIEDNQEYLLKFTGTGIVSIEFKAGEF